MHNEGIEDRYTCDEQGFNLLEYIRPDGNTVHYAWDAQDQLIKLSDAQRQTTSWSYAKRDC
ncbi:RHS repeat protein [Pseudomonas protegens]|nr:RHS repeat protein [Pseudomonas protegens]MBP5130270.1 RHS repeat protein [Pseudomonas protegens]MBP5148567.1 RHS repeat protein [Pseudomonas protegens]